MDKLQKILVFKCSALKGYNVDSVYLQAVAECKNAVPYFGRWRRAFRGSWCAICFGQNGTSRSCVYTQKLLFSPSFMVPVLVLHFIQAWK